ncbi:MAG: penicillin-binding protein 2 [Flammeovirgaceae bacterium]
MENRRFFILFLVGIVAFVQLLKLFSIQVQDISYQTLANDNFLLREAIYPNRGTIYDRNGKILVCNMPVYSLMYVPKNVQKPFDTLAFCQLMNITKEEYIDRIKKIKKMPEYSLVKPQTFAKVISKEEYARIQDLLVKFPGFFVEARTTRGYPDSVMSNSLGYIGEVSKQMLDKDTTKYYRQGDYIGQSGLEYSYEKYLRGRQGARYVMVNVHGVVKGAFRNGRFDTLPEPGKNIYTGVDLSLQQYAETLMRGKVGSLVAIEPSTGQILAMVSAPFYNPEMLAGEGLSKNYVALEEDSLKPLFNRPIMAMYPPGSIFKTVQSLIALQEGVIAPNQFIVCGPGHPMGDHAPFGSYDIPKAIQYSSNTFFYLLFRRIINQEKDPNTFKDSQIGLDIWRDYLDRFGLGRTLGIDIPNEKSGFMPGSKYYDKVYGELRWKFSTIYSLSIGQGEMLVTPLQMANLAATIANRGYYITPHLVKSIGEDGYVLPQYTKKNFIGIDSAHFELVIEGMARAIYGTAQRAIIPDIEICGKTGTAQNPHGADHSVFMAFAPRNNPKIAIAVYVENAGWGGRAAASTASLVIEKHLKGKISEQRKALEKFVLDGKFLY